MMEVAFDLADALSEQKTADYSGYSGSSDVSNESDSELNTEDSFPICEVDFSTIDKFDSLVSSLNNVFATKSCWPTKLHQLTQILQRVDLTTTETNKYTFFDYEKPYTRNLVATDGINYTLLILCWNSGIESKIHNHPCDGCFIKTLRGCIKETLYSTCEKTNNICQKSSKFYCEGQVSYMNDDLGLHKISNANKDVPAVTLHLYTPPFGSCKVCPMSCLQLVFLSPFPPQIWSDQGEGQLSKFEEGKIGFFSVYGHRTPHLEGKPGIQSKLMADIREAKQM